MQTILILYWFTQDDYAVNVRLDKGHEASWAHWMKEMKKEGP
jgi:hypothetical protein